MDFAAEREIMVDSQVRPSDVPDLAIQDAMRRVPREELLPPEKRYLAYADAPVEYAPGCWMLPPRDVAKLLHGAAPQPGERALAIASPYAAAVLDALGCMVTRQDDPAAAIAGDWSLIVCEGSVERIPDAWTRAIGPNGRLALVQRDSPVGHAKLFMRGEQGIGTRTLFDCSVPTMAGFARERGFVF